MPEKRLLQALYPFIYPPQVVSHGDHKDLYD